LITRCSTRDEVKERTTLHKLPNDMTPDDPGDGHLDLEVQRLLGAALRAEYGDLVAQLPERFVRLLLPLRELDRGKRRHPVETAAPPPPLFVDANFDPETLAVLVDSFEDGWETLQSLGNTTITRDALAKRLLELARTGERNPSRLCTTALVTLLARFPD
jgi:hypothetical protein